MAKRLTDAEARLHKRYIPINITVCAISVIAALTLFLLPIISVDVGKVLRDDRTIAFVDEIIQKAVGKEVEDSSQKDVDFAPVVSKMVASVFRKAKGEISINAADAMKVATAPEDQKGDVAFDLLLTGEKAILTELVNSVVDGVGELFDSDEGKTFIEDALVTAIALPIVAGNDALGGNITEDNIRNLADAFRGVENVQDGDVTPVVDALAAELGAILGEELDETTRQSLNDSIKDMYDQAADAVDEGEDVTFETLICVAISSSVDLSQFDLTQIFGGLLGSDSSDQNNAPLRKAGEQSSDDLATTYDELLSKMGFGADEREQLKANLRISLNRLIAENLSVFDEYAGYYGYVFYGMLVFIGLWALQFIFALIHIFTRNKRFTCWYTKAFCWIPVIFWIAVVALPNILGMVAGDMLSGEMGALIPAIMSGLVSFTWINGLCYIALWLVTTIWTTIVKNGINRDAVGD